ncbi:MAG: hypothetical protein KIT09_00675 [Bryobacteraceae bacterium]|nr:hypothetical protein [Bryobacteraceae bacterium]
MSYDYRIMSASGAQPQAGETPAAERAEAIRPTVLIGLGGTGGDVVLKVRKKIFERYGRPQDFPALQYLYIDTDTSNQHIDSTLLEEFKLNPAERYDAIVPDTSRYTRHLSQYPRIKAWWYPSMHDLGAMTVGAGQIRGYSRLGFFAKFSEIRAAIENALNSANASADEMLRRWRVEVETARGANIYIVASLAGGTGSGMFIDTAFLCRTLSPSSVTVGYLVLPGVFLRNQERIFANSYAALKELEHFSFPENGFPYQWSDGYPPAARLPLPPPPFSYCYLLDSTNEDGKALEFKTRYTMFEMIANSIFHDFGSSVFAAKKRSVRVNLDQFLTGFYAAQIKDPHDPRKNLLTEAFTTRQSSFGLTSMQYPADRIKRALAAKLSADIVRRLKTGQPPAGEFGRWVQEQFFDREVDLFIGTAMIEGRPTQRNAILDALYRSSQPGKTIVDAVEEHVQAVQHTAETRGYEGRSMTLSQYLRSEVERALVKIRDENFDRDPMKWGDWMRWIKENKEGFLAREIVGSVAPNGERTPARLETAFSGIVNDSEKGITFARHLAKEMRRILTDEAFPYRATFRREAEQLSETIQSARAAYEDKLALIQRHEHQRWLVRTMFGGAEIEHLRNGFFENLREYLKAVVRQRSRQEAIHICDVILERLGDEGRIDDRTGDRVGDFGIAGDLLKLENTLEKLARALDQTREEYSKPVEDQNTLLIYDPVDIDNRYYPRYIGADDAARVRKINETAAELLAVLPSPDALDRKGVKLMELPRLLDVIGEKDTVQRILAHCQQPFTTVQDDFEVVEMFFDRYKDEHEQRRQLSLLLSKARVWLQHSEASRFVLGEANRTFIVGRYKNVNKPANYNKFERMVEQSIQRKPAFEDLPGRNEVIFYSECAGFPTCYSRAVHDMKEFYNKLAFEQFANLHADRNEHKFNDILEMTERDRDELEEAVRVFVIGMILDVVTPIADEEEMVFTVQEKIGLTVRARPIGTQHRAVHHLLHDDRLRMQLNQFIHEREADLRSDPADWAKYYAVVSHYEKHIYPPKKVEKVSKEHLYQATTENLVLRRKIREIETAAGADREALEAKGQEYLENFAEAARPLADPFVAVKHTWKRAAAVRV